jgi:hypothetical protein
VQHGELRAVAGLRKYRAGAADHLRAWRF